ncbi:hypothetical protein EE612_023709, partial [Oryza sativa]
LQLSTIQPPKVLDHIVPPCRLGSRVDGEDGDRRGQGGGAGRRRRRRRPPPRGAGDGLLGGRDRARDGAGVRGGRVRRRGHGAVARLHARAGGGPAVPAAGARRALRRERARCRGRRRPGARPRRRARQQRRGPPRRAARRGAHGRVPAGVRHQCLWSNEADSCCYSPNDRKGTRYNSECWKYNSFGSWTMGWCIFSIKSRSSCIERYAKTGAKKFRN